MIFGPDPWGAQAAARDIIYAIQGGLADPAFVDSRCRAMAVGLGFPAYAADQAHPTILLLFIVARLVEGVQP